MLAEKDLYDHADVLRGMPIEHQDFLGRYTQYRTYHRNSFIFQPGDSTEWVYFVVSGIVKNSEVSKEGREVIKAVFKAGQMFGEDGLAGRSQYNDYAGTLRSSADVMRIPSEALVELVNRSTDMAHRFLGHFGQRLYNADKNIADLVFHDARTRLVGFIKDMAEKVGVAEEGVLKVHHGFTHQDMANITGTSRQLATIVLNDLRRKKVIKFDRNNIYIYKYDLLA